MTLKLDSIRNALSLRGTTLRVTTAFVLLIFLWMAILPSEPARSGEFVCRHYNHHEICVLSIKRSAKNYWEYLASVRVDGVKRPIERYDCRNRDRVDHTTSSPKDTSEKPTLLSKAEVSSLICSFFKK
jgi:hypothetical protein